MFGGDEVPARRGPPDRGALAAGTGGEQGNQLGCYQGSRPAPRKRNGPSQSCTQNILPPSAQSGALGLRGLGGPALASPTLGCPRPGQAPWEVLGGADDIATSLACDSHHEETSGALSRVPPSREFCTGLQSCRAPTLSQGLPPDRVMHTNIPARVQCPSAAHPHSQPSLTATTPAWALLPTRTGGHSVLPEPGAALAPDPAALTVQGAVRAGVPMLREATRGTRLSCVCRGVGAVAALGCGGCGTVAAGP